MPVLPDVGSMMTLSGLSMPRRSARSSFIHTSTRDGKSRWRRTWGVLPIVSRMVLARMGRSEAWLDVEFEHGVRRAARALQDAFVGDDRAGRHAVREPDVAADDAAGADDGVAAQDGGVGVDHHVVVHGG